MCLHKHTHEEREREGRINEVCYRMEWQKKLHSRRDCALRNLKDKHTYIEEECRRESRRRWIHKIFHLNPLPIHANFCFIFIARSCRRTYELYVCSFFASRLEGSTNVCILRKTKKIRQCVFLLTTFFHRHVFINPRNTWNFEVLI